ncbi:MAG: multicomponent Na+:H+ antiporter subunit E [Bacteroidia bacterium]|jgi:multicomponent Na+:H+ antiporter subunit E
MFTAVFWVILTDGEPSSWLLGIPAIVLTVWMMHRFPLFKAPLKIHLGPLLKFIPWFLLKSIRGGLEVSRPALSRSLSLNPALFEHECALVDPRSMAIFAMCLNVLPGTTTVRMDAGTILIHSLTSVAAARLEVAELEQKITTMLVATSMEYTLSTHADARGSTAK